MRFTGIFVLAGVGASIGAWIGAVALSGEPGTQPAPATQVKPKSPPLLLVDVSARLVQKLVGQHVERTEAFHDVIRDTPVTGMVKTVGDTRAELVPDPEHGVVDVVFDGSNLSQEVGQRPMTRVYTRTSAGFEVSYRVVFDAEGFRGSPGYGGAKALIDLVDVVDRWGDRDGVAEFVRRGFPQEQRELESIASAKTRVKTCWRLAAEMQPVLDNANQQLVKLALLKEDGLDVSGLRVATSGSHLHGAIGLSRPEKGPIKPAPAFAPDADVSLRLNEAVINAVARNTLGGKKLRLAEAKQLVDDVLSPLLRDGRKEADRLAAIKAVNELLADPAAKDASLTLAQDDPLHATFGPGTFTATIHIGAMQLGGVNVPGHRIQADFRAEAAKEGGVDLVRQGKVEVIPDDKAKGTVAAAAAAMLKALSNELMTDRLTVASLPRPAAIPPVRIIFADGWLTATWTMKE
jgi:hypothetical protein